MNATRYYQQLLQQWGPVPPRFQRASKNTWLWMKEMEAWGKRVRADIIRVEAALRLPPGDPGDPPPPPDEDE